jgi:hypothetical protein
MEEISAESMASSEGSSQNPSQDLSQDLPLAPSIWQAKPWWCQPWSIVLTGVVIVAASWLLLHRLWITLPVMSVILLWWIVFLAVVPAQYAAAVREITDKESP